MSISNAGKGQKAPTSSTANPYKLLTLDQLSSSKSTKRWLVEQVLVENQTAVISGPKKSLKSSFAVDLAVSIATGTLFLNKFRVPTPQRVAIFSDSSGRLVLPHTAKRILRSKKLEPSTPNLLLRFERPALCDAGDLEVLRRTIQHYKVKVAIFDPLYLCLLEGSSLRSATNLFDVGSALKGAADACLSAGAMPVFVHQNNKVSNKTCGEPRRPNLEDLAFAGVAEFARQWILIHRPVPFEEGSGSHKLVISTGGSIGHSGRWEVAVEEGSMDAMFGGQKWQVSVDELLAD